ncbi:HEAT repeat domain-containing protein [Natrinema hispanicum]
MTDCIDALAGSNPGVRISAARAIAAFASAFPEEIGSSLVRTPAPFTDNADRVRANVVRAVSVIASQDPKVVIPLVPTLIERLADPNDDVRIYSATALATLADHEVSTVISAASTIVDRLEDDVTDVRLHTAEVVAAVAADSPRVLEAHLEQLLEASRTESPCIRHAMTSALDDCTNVTDGPCVVEMLFERLLDSYPAIRETAASALRQSAQRCPSSIRTPEATESLIRALADPSAGVRTNAAWALKHVGYDEYCRVALESTAEPATVAHAIAQTYRSTADLDPDAQIAGARRCSNCRTPFSEPQFEHPNVVCEECTGELSPVQTDSGNRHEISNRHTDSVAISIGGAKCWRQVRFGELVIMRDAHDCDTYAEFLDRHFTSDGTPIQSVCFPTGSDGKVSANN